MRTKITLLGIVILLICTTANGQSHSANESDEIIISGLISSAFPEVGVNVFINETCASSGGLKKEEFTIIEDGTEVPIIRYYPPRNIDESQTLDLAVVFDDTDSMAGEIEAMKAGVQDLIDQIAGSNIDARYSLVSFKDDNNIIAPWTEDTPSFKNAIDSLNAIGGDDEPEDALDAIEEVLDFNFRPDAQKVILIITDAPAHQRGDLTAFTSLMGEDVKDDLIESGVMLIAVSPKFPSDSSPYLDLKNLAIDVRGTWIDIGSADFSNILDRITSMLTGLYVMEYCSPDKTPNTVRHVQISVRNASCVSGDAYSSYSSPGKEDMYDLSYSGVGSNNIADPSQLYEGYQIKVTKNITAPNKATDPGCQNIEINISTPKIPCENTTVVLALDTSGSSGQSDLDQQMDMQIGAVIAGRPNIYYARVDWDSGEKRDMIPISRGMWAGGDFARDYRSSGIDYSGPFHYGNWFAETRDHPMMCTDTEGTTYAKALLEAVDKLKKKKERSDYFIQKANSWIVVFITGKSEFVDSEESDIQEVIAEAKKSDIDIYPIGVEISLTNHETENEARELERYYQGTVGDVWPYSDISPGNIGTTLDSILEDTQIAACSRNVAENVVLTDSIYRYLQVVDSKITASNGSTFKGPEPNKNGDGTSTLVFDLGDMNQLNWTRVTIYTELNFDDLPVDVSSAKQNRTGLDFRAHETTPTSSITYETIYTKEGKDTIYLPEGNLSIRCGNSCSQCTEGDEIAVEGPQRDTILIASESNETQKPEPAPGFEALFAAIGISLAGYICRRRVN